MRRSPRLALALLFAVAPLTAQEKSPTPAALKPLACPDIFKADPCPGFADAVPPLVTCDVKLIRVSDAVMEQLKARFQADQPKPVEVKREFGSGLFRVGLTFDPAAADDSRRVTFASASELKKLLEMAQRSAATKIIASPRLVMRAGEPAKIGVGARRHFATSFMLKSADGQMSLTPKMEAVDVGTHVEMTATPAADGQAVTLAVNARLTELGEDVTPLKPVGLELKGTTADGKPATVPMTQFVEQPTVITRGVKDTLTIPAGQSAILYASLTPRAEGGAPAPAKLPLLSRLFKNAAVKETDHLLVILTPTVESIVKPAAATGEAKTATDGQLGGLLKSYHDACAAGRKDDARRLAMECLVIDATCFGKK